MTVEDLWHRLDLFEARADVLEDRADEADEIGLLLVQVRAKLRPQAWQELVASLHDVIDGTGR
ncbi:MAG: hypothetical protein ACR2MN_08920 [Acidimicrobiales bacterium]